MVHIFSRPTAPDRVVGRLAGGLIPGLLLALAGCASVPPPDAAMTQTQAMLQAARDAGAADYDPVDLQFAQSRFQQAQAAMATRQYADAASLAEEARADAELARTKARLGEARAQVQAKARENEQLRQQIAQLGRGGSSSSSSGGESAPATLQDMPAPSASVLSAPLPQGGFQPVPGQPAPAASTSTAPDQGGQP